MAWTRRDFLETGLLASAGITLCGCTGSKKDTQVLSEKKSIIKHVPYDGYFYTNFGVSKEIIDRVLSRLMSRGGNWGELFFERTRFGTFGISDDTITQAVMTVTQGMGARCVDGEHVGYAYSESFLPEDLLEAADAAAAIAPGISAAKIKNRRTLEFKKNYDQSMLNDTIDAARAVELLRKIVIKARSRESGIFRVNAQIIWNQRTIMINTSDGINAEDNQPSCSLNIGLVMKRGDKVQQIYNSYGKIGGIDILTDETIDALIDKTAVDLRNMFDAVVPKAGEYPVILAAGSGGVVIHETVGHGLEAMHNMRGDCVFSNRMNQRIAPDEVTICDSGLDGSVRGSIHVDDEGTPGQNTVLIDRGIVRSFMHDKMTAAHYGTVSTGNGRRESFRHVPISRMRVTAMENGPHEFGDLFRNIQYGVYCTGFAGGSFNFSQGDFSVSVKLGFLIEDGRITAPIKNINIAGNAVDAFLNMDMVANDRILYFGRGVCGASSLTGIQRIPVSYGMPSVRIASLTVGGM